MIPHSPDSVRKLKELLWIFQPFFDVGLKILLNTLAPSRLMFVNIVEPIEKRSMGFLGLSCFSGGHTRFFGDSESLRRSFLCSLWIISCEPFFCGNHNVSDKRIPFIEWSWTMFDLILPLSHWRAGVCAILVIWVNKDSSSLLFTLGYIVPMNLLVNSSMSKEFFHHILQSFTESEKYLPLSTYFSSISHSLLDVFILYVWYVNVWIVRLRGMCGKMISFCATIKWISAIFVLEIWQKNKCELTTAEIQKDQIKTTFCVSYLGLIVI